MQVEVNTTRTDNGGIILTIELPPELLRGESAVEKRRRELKAELAMLDEKSPDLAQVAAQGDIDLKLNYVALDDVIAFDPRLAKIHELDAKRQARVETADQEAERKRAEAEAAQELRRKRAEAEAAQELKIKQNPGTFIDDGRTLMEED